MKLEAGGLGRVPVEMSTGIGFGFVKGEAAKAFEFDAGVFDGIAGRVEDATGNGGQEVRSEEERDGQKLHSIEVRLTCEALRFYEREAANDVSSILQTVA